MGGMIAQRVALAAPQRVLSLTSIMSSSGARGLPEAKAARCCGLCWSRPAGTGRDAVVDHYVKLFRVIGSPGYPVEEPALRERILAGLERSYHPAGTLRQMVAIGADTGRRAAELGRITAPTLVLHGKDDPLVPYPCGVDTAQARLPTPGWWALAAWGTTCRPAWWNACSNPFFRTCSSHDRTQHARGFAARQTSNLHRPVRRVAAVPDSAAGQARRNRAGHAAASPGADLWTAFELSCSRRAASRRWRLRTSPCRARR